MAVTLSLLFFATGICGTFMVVAVIVLGKLLCGCDSADVIITVLGASIVPLILLDS